MDFSSIEKQIKKISFMLETFRAQDDVITPMERELLLDYTRKLYDLFKEDEADSLPLRDKIQETYKSSVQPLVETEYVAHEKTHVANNQSSAISSSVVSAPVVEAIAKEEYKEEEIENYEETTSQLNDEILQTFSPDPEPVTTYENIAPVSSPVTNSEVEVEGMSEVFAKKEINDLSDKLGFSPIADLTKSMGINDRIRVVKELFGGDSELFNLTINRLNNLSSYEEAKFYLLNGVALDHGWNNEDKQQKAADFVKLVQRRFV